MTLFEVHLEDIYCFKKVCLQLLPAVIMTTMMVMNMMVIENSEF